MKKKYFIIAAVAVIVFFAAGAVAAAPRVRIITARLGGVAGDIFRLDGELRVRSLFVRDSLDAKYDNTVSGLAAKTYKAAIDELGINVSKLISGPSLSVSSVKPAALSTTTWKGYAYNSLTYPLTNGLVLKTEEITVVFTPTSATTGTFSSTPLYVFAPKGGALWDSGHADSLIGRCGTSYSGITYPTGTYTGNYELVDDFLVWTTPVTSSHATCKIPPSSGYAYSSDRSQIQNKGNTMYITNTDGDQIILTRQ